LQKESAITLAAAQEKNATRTGSGNAAAQRKAKQAAKDGGGSGDISDSSGGSIVEGIRSNAAALDNASGLHQNRIVMA
jgi:hypothetical protein